MKPLRIPVRRNRFWYASAGGALAALFLAACGSSHPGSTTASQGRRGLTPITMVIPTPAPQSNTAFVNVGVAKGFFKAAGINLKIDYIAGGPAALSAVQSGQADIGMTSPEPVVLADAQGGDLKSIFQMTSGLFYYFGFIKDSKVQSISQLKNATIGTTSANNEPAYTAYINAQLASKGLPVVKKFNMIATGESASAAAAVKSGRVNALFFADTGVVTAEYAGVKLKIEPVSALLHDFPGLNLLATSSVISKKQTALKATLSAFSKSMSYCVDQPKACMSEFEKIDPDAAGSLPLAEAGWAIRAPLYKDSISGTNSAAAWANVEKLQEQAGTLKGQAPPPSSLYTNSLLGS